MRVAKFEIRAPRRGRPRTKHLPASKPARNALAWPVLLTGAGFLSKPGDRNEPPAAVRRCREGRENRPQWRCGIGSQFRDARIGDDARVKPIGESSPVKASEKGARARGVEISHVKSHLPRPATNPESEYLAANAHTRPSEWNQAGPNFIATMKGGTGCHRAEALPKSPHAHAPPFLPQHRKTNT